MSNTTSSDDTSNKWYVHQNKLSTPLSDHSMTTINKNQIIITGGTTSEIFDFTTTTATLSGQNLKSVHRIDVSNISTDDDDSTTSWEIDTIPNIDEERYCAAAVVVKHTNEEYIYLFGGNNDGYSLSSCLRYKAEAEGNYWEPIASMISERSGHAAVNVNGKIYILGGHNGENDINTMEMYDPDADVYTECPSLPISSLFRMTAVSIQDKYIVVNGGYNAIQDEINNQTFLYDTKRRIWKIIDNPYIATPREFHAAATVVLLQQNNNNDNDTSNDTNTTTNNNNKSIIVISGGRDSNFEDLNTIEYITFDELVYGKLWDRRKKIILLRCLVERGRATTIGVPKRKKRTRKSKKEEYQRLCFVHLITKSNNDVFRSVMKFL